MQLHLRDREEMGRSSVVLCSESLDGHRKSPALEERMWKKSKPASVGSAAEPLGFSVLPVHRHGKHLESGVAAVSSSMIAHPHHCASWYISFLLFSWGEKGNFWSVTGSSDD